MVWELVCRCNVEKLVHFDVSEMFVQIKCPVGEKSMSMKCPVSEKSLSMKCPVGKTVSVKLLLVNCLRPFLVYHNTLSFLPFLFINLLIFLNCIYFFFTSNSVTEISGSTFILFALYFFFLAVSIYDLSLIKHHSDHCAHFLHTINLLFFYYQHLHPTV